MKIAKILSLIAVVAAVGGAVITKAGQRAQASLFTKVSAPCHLILCSTVNQQQGLCPITAPKFQDNKCLIREARVAYRVTNQ